MENLIIVYDENLNVTYCKIENCYKEVEYIYTYSDEEHAEFKFKL